MSNIISSLVIDNDFLSRSNYFNNSVIEFIYHSLCYLNKWLYYFLQVQ